MCVSKKRGGAGLFGDAHRGKFLRKKRPYSYKIHGTKSQGKNRSGKEGGVELEKTRILLGGGTLTPTNGTGLECHGCGSQGQKNAEIRTEPDQHTGLRDRGLQERKVMRGEAKLRGKREGQHHTRGHDVNTGEEGSVLAGARVLAWGHLKH